MCGQVFKSSYAVGMLWKVAGWDDIQPEQSHAMSLKEALS